MLAGNLLNFRTEKFDERKDDKNPRQLRTETKGGKLAIRATG